MTPREALLYIRGELQKVAEAPDGAYMNQKRQLKMHAAALALILDMFLHEMAKHESRIVKPGDIVIP